MTHPLTDKICDQIQDSIHPCTTTEEVFKMSFTAEGTIEIDLAEFFTWVYENYAPSSGAELKYGVPRTNKSNQTLEIDFAMATDCDPGDWTEKPDAVKQWKDT